MYEITDYTYRKAKQMGYTVKPSTKSGKKIDVFKDGKFVQAIGSQPYLDYGHYLIIKGKRYADERRRLYHLRHTGNTLGEVLSRQLLW